MDTVTYNSTEKIAYLTFDDGPSEKVTPKILDILNKYDIKATFFVIGKNVATYPEIIKRIHKEGHLIGNHTYTHNNSKLYSSKEAFINEINKTNTAIKKALELDEYNYKIFRFPNGYSSPIYSKQKQEYVKYLSDLGYKFIDWNALNNDAERIYTNDMLLENLKTTSKGKSSLIILMHDSGDVNPTHEVLEASIKYLLEEGYKFSSLSEFAK